jgi:hypothetical protein
MKQLHGHCGFIREVTIKSHTTDASRGRYILNTNSAIAVPGTAARLQRVPRDVGGVNLFRLRTVMNMSRYLVDPEPAAGLDVHLPATLGAGTFAQYRSMLFDMVAAIPKPTSDAMRRMRFEERHITGTLDVRVLVYTPAGRSDALLPAILHVHGSGFLGGNADMSDPNSRAYDVEINCVVVSIDYRLLCLSGDRLACVARSPPGCA